MQSKGRRVASTAAGKTNISNREAKFYGDKDIKLKKPVK